MTQLFVQTCHQLLKGNDIDNDGSNDANDTSDNSCKSAGTTQCNTNQNTADCPGTSSVFVCWQQTNK